MDLSHVIACLEKRVRELETAQAVTAAKQQNIDVKLDEFIQDVKESNEKQTAKIDLLTRALFIATGVLGCLQALGILKS